MKTWFKPKKHGAAGFRRRLAAFLLDVLPITFFVGLLFYFNTEFGPAWDNYFDNLGDEESRKRFLKERNKVRNTSALVYLVYAAILEASLLRGTIGKWMVGAVVVDQDGKRLSFGKALTRNVVKMISIIPAFLGCLASLFNESRQAWHDRWVRSFVLESEPFSLLPGTRDGGIDETR